MAAFAAGYFSDSFGYGPDFAVVLGVDGEDAVGLAKVEALEDYALGFVGSGHLQQLIQLLIQLLIK